MSPNAFQRFQIIVIAVLLVVIITGGVIILVRFPRIQAIEISIPAKQESMVTVVAGGALNNPGIYSFNSSDTITAILSAAGGFADNADKTGIVFNVPRQDDEKGTQKININRAEAWLLEALPGIGETLARHIIEYREYYGPFQNINEITRVEGITLNIYEKIKNSITVTD